MKKYLLSVCIPTANRKKELAEQLTRLVDQMARLDNVSVQIVICDNTEYSEQLIDVNFFDHDDIKYIKNPGNVGYGENINNVIRHANGDFVWLLSDDDFIFDNALSTVVGSLLQNRNINYVAIECGGSYNGRLFCEKMYFNEDDLVYYEDGSAFLNKHWGSIIFISINIFDRLKMLGHMNKFKLFDVVNEVYQQALVGITYICQYGGVLIIKEPLLNDNYGNKVYAPESLNNVAIDKYHKLLGQLREFNAPPRVLTEMSNKIYGNILFYGFRSVVYNIEHSKLVDFSTYYETIYKNNENIVKVRVASFLVFLLLSSNKHFSKHCLTLLLLMRRIVASGAEDYAKISQDVNAMVKESKSKIPSSY